jgi:hypothetical protein
MSEDIEYEVIPYLIFKGFDGTTAEQISEETGVEWAEDLRFLKVETVFDLHFLTDDQKKNLWALANEMSMAWLLWQLEQHSI